MNINSLHNIYFIGIGGIGMSSLARYFKANGKNVAGYDKTQTPLTKELENLNIQIHYKDSLSLIPKGFLKSKTTLIIYTPAIPKSHSELIYFIDNDFNVLKRAEILGIITKNSFCFAIAGTHGKTTTSSILGHIMSSKNATAFLGGISENYKSNLILGGDEITVVEADEFDKSFLKLSPNIACITSTDADHLDIYGDATEFISSFKEFAALVKEQVVIANGLPFDGITYGIEDNSDYCAKNIRIENGNFIFDVYTPKDCVLNIQFSLPGNHNIMNAMAALTMAHLYGIELQEIKKYLTDFKGVQRRFSYKIKTNSFVLIDDYAHHPTEIKAVANSIKEMYGGQKNLVVFQPHLFSRTRDFADDFAESLGLFDEVLLLDIYPARELPIEGISSSWLLNKIKAKSKKLTYKSNLYSDIKNSSAQIVAMLGAGDIGLMIEDVCSKIKINQKQNV